MVLLTETYIKERDVDWYCLVDGVPAHFASMGGMIPERFRDKSILRHNQDVVATMSVLCDARLNIENIEQQITDGYDYLENESLKRLVESYNKNNPGFIYLNEYRLPVRLYASSFVEKARRGFRSYARKEYGNGNEYVLIAEPVSSIDLALCYGDRLHLEELEDNLLNDGIKCG